MASIDSPQTTPSKQTGALGMVQDWWSGVTASVSEAMKKCSARLQPQHDGHFIGGTPNLLPPETPLDQLVPLPVEGVDHTLPLMIFLNGINCDEKHTKKLACETSRKTKHPVVALFNQTAGMPLDIVNVALNKADYTSKKVVASLQNVLVQAIRSEKPLVLAAHSHGAVVVSQAIARVKTTLVKSGEFSTQQIEDKLGELIQVETYGGAATQYPDGPEYIHYVDERDMVAWFFGVARYGLEKKAIGEIQAQNFGTFLQGVKWETQQRCEEFMMLTQKLIAPGRGHQIVRIPPNPFDPHDLSNHLAARKLTSRQH